MAIDDISFYTITGEEISRGMLVEQMINYYLLKLDAGETQVTDFNEGSEIRNLLEAIAVDMYALMEEQNELLAMGFVETAEGEWLDKHGANPWVNLPRDTGMEASGFVTFTIDEALTDDITIPEGTIVMNTETGLDYMTLYDATLPVNETDVTVAVECLTEGEDGNCDEGKIDYITEITADIPANLSVTNEKPLTGGFDYEEDDEYRDRLMQYTRKDDFGSFLYYIQLAESVNGVHDATLIDREGFTKAVIVNADIKPAPMEVLSDVLTVFTDITNIVIGHTFTVDTPGYIDVDLTVDLTVTEIISDEIIEALLKNIFDGGSNVDAGFPLEFPGLNMGEDVTNEKIKSNLLLLDGVETAKIYITGEQTEFDIITTNENEVCKLTAVHINQTIVE